MGLPTTEEVIRAAEQALGRRLPAPLRERLLSNNGGDVTVTFDDGEEEDWQLHPVWDPSSRDTMRRSANHLAKEQQAARAWPGFPDGAIAIADEDGDQLVLLRGEDEPRVWLHETAELCAVTVTWND